MNNYDNVKEFESIEEEIIYNQTDEARAFDGVFIPSFIWLSKEFTWTEKIIFIEIKSLTKKDGYCVASNQYLSKFCGCSERTLSQTISLYKNIGVIDIVSFDGRRRKIRINENYENIIKNYRKPRLEDNTEESRKKCNSAGNKMQPYNNRLYNIENNKLLSNSNKFELSNNSGSDEPSVCSDTFSVIENNNPAVPSVYETTENKNNSACAQNVSASSNNYVDETHNCVDTSVEQSELDEINALKKFKSSQSTKHKKGEKKKTDNPFTRCLNVTNSKTQYNERVKNALYRFLQFRIKCAHTDETVWSSLLDSLEDCIKDAPTKDEGKLNILREKVIMNSLQGSYRKFFPLDAKSISTILNNTFTDNNIINNGLNNTSSNPIGPIDSTKLALNPDGTPMIF